LPPLVETNASETHRRWLKPTASKSTKARQAGLQILIAGNFNLWLSPLRSGKTDLFYIVVKEQNTAEDSFWKKTKRNEYI